MSTAPAKVNRRRFLRRAALCTVGTAAATGFYAWRIEPHWVALEQRPMPLSQLPAELEGARLAHITDLHVSTIVDYDYLQHSIAQVAELDPEIVVITGDLMTARYLEQVDSVVHLLKQLQPDQRKVIVTPGNHDYGRGTANTKMVDTLFARLEREGIECLRNQLTDYRGLQIVGLDEYWARRFRPRQALEGFDVTRGGLALSHNPDTVDQSGWDCFRGWILSGHTHGGQCRLPYFGAPIIPISNPRYTAGEVAISTETTLYVNRGLGYSRRVRFMCSPEITLFTLTAQRENLAAT